MKINKNHAHKPIQTKSDEHKENKGSNFAKKINTQSASRTAGRAFKAKALQAKNDKTTQEVAKIGKDALKNAVLSRLKLGKQHLV